MRKAMWRILPLILLAYMVAYIDRVNVSFASLQMNDDLKFSATIYGLGGGLFFLGYALFEVPSSLMLARVSAPQWIARIMINARQQLSRHLQFHGEVAAPITTRNTPSDRSHGAARDDCACNEIFVATDRICRICGPSGTTFDTALAFSASIPASRSPPWAS